MRSRFTFCERRLQLSFLLRMPNLVSKGFESVMRKVLSRRSQRCPTTYKSFKSASVYCVGCLSLLKLTYMMWGIIAIVLMRSLFMVGLEPKINTVWVRHFRFFIHIIYWRVVRFKDFPHIVVAVKYFYLHSFYTHHGEKISIKKNLLNKLIKAGPAGHGY